MKRTPEDDDFAIRFASELTVAYRAAKSSDKTDEEFAASIGVMRQQLKKYLTGKAMPCVRTVALAKKNHQITVPYAETIITDAKKKPRMVERPVQLNLPFTIQATGSDQLNVRLKSASSGRVELDVMIRRVG